MKKLFSYLLLSVLLLLGVCNSNAQWYTAYYASWNQDAFNSSSWNGEKLGQPPDQVDWTGITHVVHFGNGNVSSTAPYFLNDSTEITYGAGGGNTNYQNQLISVCHGKGIKVLLSIQAVDGAPLLAVVQDAAKLNVFCNRVASYAKLHGYDGVEIDWESSFPSTAQMTTFLTALRTTLDAYYLPTRALIATSANLGDYNMYAPSTDALIDQHNIQTYAMMWTPNDNNFTWHTCAVYPGTSNNGAEGALDGITNGDVGYPQQWVNAGHDASKIGLLLPTFGYFCLGADGLLQKPTSVIGHNGSMTVTQNSMLTGLLSVGGVKTWDAVRQMDYIHGTATAAYGTAEYGGVKLGQKFFATVPTPRWVDAVITYVQTKTFNGKHLGGVSLYSLTEDFDPSRPAGSGRNIIHDAMRDAFPRLLSIKESPIVPMEFTILSNYPNPFNPATTIQYTIPSEVHVKLAVYDVLGREVAVLVNETQTRGTYTAYFDGHNLSSGLYLCRWTAGSTMKSIKMVLSK